MGPLGSSLRMDLNLHGAADFQPLLAPSWVNAHDLDEALLDLEKFGVCLDADTLLSQGDSEPRMFFAWLHSQWLWALCRHASAEAEAAMRVVFAVADDQFGSEILYWTVHDNPAS